MNKPGRPTKRTEDTVGELLERQSHGEPLTRICADPRMPAFRTVFQWEAEDEQFAHVSARARAIGTHHLAHECIEIADGDGDPQDKRIRIDTRIRLIGKWNAKDYGDRQVLEHTVSDDFAEQLAEARKRARGE